LGARAEQATSGRRGQALPAKEASKPAPKHEAVVRGTKAVGIVQLLASRVPSLIEQSHLETQEAWNAYWSPIFRCLATQCVNPCREIRHQAFNALQRCLQSKDLASPDHKEWTKIFGEVLFPLINELLKPEVLKTDPFGMGDTRVQASQLLCKTFLHYLVLLSEWPGVLDLWTRILDTMERLVGSSGGQNDLLSEAVPESLKNILLVMAGDGYIVPPREAQSESQKRLWSETETRLERFLPGLMAELFPDAGKMDAESEEAKEAPAAVLTADGDAEKAASTVGAEVQAA
jgi:brefeldin A-resistance guanine nucleotide exchange factor 1